MLDKELQQIVRGAKQGRRYADKLVKVWLKSGEERWLLIHIEVQSRKEKDFPKRMYVYYNYRIFDRYDQEAVSLAILADDDPGWRPTEYGYGRWGFHAGVKFPVVKLLDYAAHSEALESNPNPFAMVFLAHLKTMETRSSPADRRVWKLRLVKGLYERGLIAEDIRRIFAFVDWIMDLPEPLERLFWEEINAYQKEKRMPFVTIAERVGMEKVLLEGIEALLEVRFGEEGLTLLPEIREIQDHEALRKILRSLKTAGSTDEVRRIYTRARRPKKTRRR
ncbi:MAG TPA: hypothetical protein VMV69_08185 [Pirellulales bacterium]|nr:hypothetical protein [Pirellulales bacterium]